MTPEEWLPYFADSMGQGANPDGWIYWHQLPRDMEMPYHGNGRAGFKKYDHQEWREIVITGYLVEQDCKAQGGC